MGGSFILYMMETRFEISLNMKTLKGIETYGYFPLGKDEHFARSVFGMLHGEDFVFPNSVITIDLIKREDGVPFPLGLKHCNYDQLACNVKMITRELFKQLNLDSQLKQL